jgi:hypothetical protein
MELIPFVSSIFSSVSFIYISNEILFLRVKTALLKISCEISAYIAGNCVLCWFNSEFTYKINKITYKTDKNTNIFVNLLVLFAILLILFVNSLLKNRAHSCQL